MVLGALLVACIRPVDLSEKQKMEVSMNQGEARYLALGDSYTIGEGVAEAQRWPAQLAAQLRKAGIAMADPLIIARTGWTTDELAAGIAAKQLQGPFDLVTLLIGVNNQYRHRLPTEYREQFRNLLHQAVAFADGKPDHVIVVSIPDWSVTPFAQGRDRQEIAAEIDYFNVMNREEASQAGARYVDVTPLSRQAAADLTLLADDQLHPSGKMYSAWVKLVLPEAMAILR
jgi:lysophospholipase L1-like esterase